MKKVNGVLTDVNKEDLELLKTNPEKFWEGVTVIGYRAFFKLEGIDIMIIPDCITKIEDEAFFNSELKQVIFSKSLISIGCEAFAFCENLESAIIPDSVTKLDMAAFYECRRLRKAIIPSSLKQLEDDVFACCNRLKTIEMHSDIEINVNALPDQLCFEYYSPKAKKSIFSTEELDLPDEYVKIEFLEFCPEERLEIIKQINEGTWQPADLDEPEEENVVYDEKTQKQIQKLQKIIEDAQKMIEDIKNKNNNSNN